MVKHTEIEIVKEQFGLRRLGAFAGHFFIVRQICEMMKEKKILID